MRTGKEIIITGGSGFLGTKIINNISEKYRIISIDKRKNKTKKKIKTFSENLKTFFKKKNLKNVFCIIHLAVSNPRASVYEKSPNLLKKNIDDLAFILEKIKNSKKKILLIFASSRDVEKNKYNRDLYSFSKEYCENLIKQYSINNKFNFCILRMPDLFDYKLSENPKYKALYKISKNLQKSENIIVSNSSHTFEYISTDDVSNLISNILDKKKNKNMFISLRGQKINILKFIKKISHLKSFKPKIIIKNKLKENIFTRKIIKNKKNNFFNKLIFDL